MPTAQELSSRTVRKRQRGLRADAARNRDAIVETAIRVFSSSPMATMEDVAQASGLGRTTVYRHFERRELLVAAAFVEALAAARAEFMAARLDEGPALDALRRATEGGVRASDRYRMLVRGPGVDPTPAVEQRYAEVLDLLIPLIERAQREGVLRDDQPARWLADVHLVTLATAMYRDPEQGDLVDMVLSTFLNGAAAGA